MLGVFALKINRVYGKWGLVDVRSLFYNLLPEVVRPQYKFLSELLELERLFREASHSLSMGLMLFYLLQIIVNMEEMYAFLVGLCRL